MMADYEKAKENYNNIEKLDLFYNYNTGAGAVGLYDYQTIRKIQEWNDNGIVEILGENCEMTDQEIRKWYADRIGSMFDPRWGTPEITVDVERNPL